MKNLLKRFSILLIVILVSTFQIQAQKAHKWSIDRSHSSVNFDINHFFSKVNGKFTDIEGTIDFDPSDLAGSNIDVRIKVASINTSDAQRDEHLLNADWFEVEKFSNMSFKSTKFVKKAKNKFNIHGKLTIRDKTKDIVLPMTVLGIADNIMKPGDIVMGVTASTNILRNDYGVGAGSFAGTAVVGNKVNININLELHRSK